MITAYLQGGLGNQMAIYASGLALAKKFDTGLKLNIGSFTRDPMREYSLHLFSGVTEHTESCLLIGDVVRETNLRYSPETAKKFTKDCAIHGYWQAHAYFDEIADSLAWRFTPRQSLTERGKETLRQIQAAGYRSVFLTVRRTDYVGSTFHGQLSIEYYLRALDILSAKVPTPEIFVFSDDPEWCRENIRFPYKTTIAGNFDRTVKGHIGREDEELWLMRHCQHAIMANSSYSFWGAYLGADKRGGAVIAPRVWFRDNQEDATDVMKPEWITI